MRIAVAAAVLFVACMSTKLPPRFVQPVIESASVPKLEDVLPISQETNVGIIAGASQTRKAYTVRVGDMDFTVGVDDEHKIAYIGTTDPSFHPPEGLKLGDSLAVVQRAAPGEKLFLENGWGQYVRLPSGWYAFMEGKRPRVTMFFARR